MTQISKQKDLYYCQINGSYKISLTKSQVESGVKQVTQEANVFSEGNVANRALLDKHIGGVLYWE